MHGVRFILAAALATLLGCDKSPPPPQPAAKQTVELRIAAAASLKSCLGELAAAFSAKDRSITVTPTYGASGTFYAQLQNKAPFDVFLSADIQYPHKLAEANLAAPNSERIYARGSLVVWVPKKSTLDIEHTGVAALTSPDIKHLAIANPQLAPYGRAAEAALKAASIYDALSPKLTLGGNVEQAAQFAQTGAADAAIIPLSLALAPVMMDSGRSVRIPESLYSPVEHGLVITAWSEHQVQARAFADYILGAEGQAVLARYGFSPPKGEH
jgi:molybdate transport system substrate-binding protein